MAIVIDGYTVDVAVSEDIRLVSDITEYPVETGSSITDHVRNLPIEVTIEGIVSDTPIGPLANERSFVDLPSEEFLARLELIHVFREPIVVETTRRVYESMVLRDLSIPTDARTGNSLSFRATFVQIDLVTNDRVQINVQLPRAKKQKRLGGKNPKVSPLQVPSPAASVLSQVNNLLGKGLGGPGVSGLFTSEEPEEVSF